jgi:hypothetical protein
VSADGFVHKVKKTMEQSNWLCRVQMKLVEMEKEKVEIKGNSEQPNVKVTWT